jgi:hypothetical protein
LFLDVADEDEVIPDAEGIAFSDAEVAIEEAVRGARELVAHRIMSNEDLSGQSFVIRGEDGQTVATLGFRDRVPASSRPRQVVSA